MLRLIDFSEKVRSDRRQAMAVTEPSLVLLSGLGGDARYYAPQKAAFPQLQVPPWLDPQRGETLAAYAARLAATLDVKRPMVLGGSSMGGMVAYEMARLLRPQAVVLIGSASSCDGIPRYHRWLAPLLRVMPLAGIRTFQGIAPLTNRFFGARTPEQGAVFVRMLRDTRPEFIRWACGAILGWAPEPLEGVPVFSIHGATDKMLPSRRCRAEVIVPGAGHLLSLAHPQPVNDFLRSVLDKVAASNGR
jgi:pimeloyl-ACP methyl ester carboxylesterase